jgi:CRP-like cAMP-binding protein
MSRTPSDPRRRKHLLTDKMKALSAKALAQKVGYLRVEDFPGSSLFATLPRQHYSPRRTIRPKNALCLVSGGVVQIRHSHHDYLVKELAPGSLFGDVPLLGQTMLVTEAVAGAEGALISFMSAETARGWIRSSPVAILEKVGSKLALVEDEHYRSIFQLADSRIAAFFIEYAGEGSTVEGLTHQEIGERLGMYRETVTHTLGTMKVDKLIEVDRMKITLLDKRALRELSEL